MCWPYRVFTKPKVARTIILKRVWPELGQGFRRTTRENPPTEKSPLLSSFIDVYSNHLQNHELLSNISSAAVCLAVRLIPHFSGSLSWHRNRWSKFLISRTPTAEFTFTHCWVLSEFFRSQLRTTRGKAVRITLKHLNLNLQLHLRFSFFFRLILKHLN